MLENMNHEQKKAMGAAMRTVMKEIVLKDPDCPDDIKVGFNLEETYRRIHEKLSVITELGSLSVDETKERLEYLACVEGGLDSFMEQKGIHYDEE